MCKSCYRRDTVAASLSTYVSVWFCIFVPGSAGISYFLSWSHSDSLSLSLSLLLLLISFYIMRATNALPKSLFDAS